MSQSDPSGDGSGGASGALPGARRLRTTFAAVRLSISWLGVRKTLTVDQKAQAADTFGAEGQYLSAAKKLLDTKHPAYKAVTTIRGKAIALWKGMSLPYPEPGVRLIRQDDIEPLTQQMQVIRGELDEAVESLDRAYANLREAAKGRLGRLYNQTDYPPSLQGLFQIDWDFPSVEPPDYLRRLNPQLYEEEQRRIAARFDEAVKLAEEAFTSELGKLVAHLTERLTGGGGGVDGKPQVFRDSAVTNLREFFERFKSLSVQSNPELDRLVELAQQAVQGVQPQDLRDHQSLRTQVVTELAQVQSVLETLLVDRPRRKILRSGPAPATGMGPASAQAVA